MGVRTLKLQDPPIRSDDVTALQQALVNAGIALTVNGIFGPITQSQVPKPPLGCFQSQQGLRADGIVALATRAALGL